MPSERKIIMGHENVAYRLPFNAPNIKHGKGNIY